MERIGMKERYLEEGIDGILGLIKYGIWRKGKR